MNYNKILKIEKEFPTGGFTGYLFHKAGGFDMIEAAILPDGSAGSVLKGTAPVAERRAMFLELWAGFFKMAIEIKDDAAADLQPLNH